MHSKVLALPFLLGSALAAAELEKKEYGDYPDYGNDDYYSSLMGDLDSLATNTDYMDYLTDLPTGYSKYLPSEATNSPTTESDSDSDKSSVTAGPTMPSFDLPPASIQSVLVTAIPASYLSQMANPSAASSIYKEIENGHYPDWYKSLPGSVKDWLSTHYADGNAAATGTSNGADSDSESGSDSRGKGDVPGAAPPSGVVATGLMAAAGVLAVAIML